MFRWIFGAMTLPNIIALNVWKKYFKFGDRRMSTEMIMKAIYDPDKLRRELMRYKKADLIEFVIWMGQSVAKLLPKEE